jgi:hypothetical protein
MSHMPYIQSFVRIQTRRAGDATRAAAQAIDNALADLDAGIDAGSETRTAIAQLQSAIASLQHVEGVREAMRVPDDPFGLEAA